MGPKKNSKGKAAGSGTVSSTRREKFKQKGLLRENADMEKEDQVVDWEEDRKKGNKKTKLLSEEEVSEFFKPKKGKPKEEKEEDEGPERPPGVWDFKAWAEAQKKKQEDKKKQEEQDSKKESTSLDKREKEPAKKELQPSEAQKVKDEKKRGAATCSPKGGAGEGEAILQEGGFSFHILQ